MNLQASNNEAVGLSPVSSLSDDAQIAEKKQCPQPLPMVSWSMLGYGLQVYLFNSLKRYYHGTDAAVQVLLGLTIEEVKHVSYLRNLKQIHFLTPEQVWEHCLRLDNGNRNYVRPTVLTQYMSYFVFAENVSSTTQSQILLALKYLRQRGIQSRVVDTFLPERTSLYGEFNGEVQTIVPRVSPLGDGNGVLDSSSTGNSGFHDSWQNILQHYKIHESHDQNLLSLHFRCVYFPSRLRHWLVSKPINVMNITDLWLLYGPASMQKASSHTPDTPSIKLSLPQNATLSQMIIEFLKPLVEEQLTTDDAKTDNRQVEELASIFLYANTAVVTQDKLVRKQIDRMPLSSSDKKRMLGSAKLQNERNVLADLKSRLVKYQQVQCASRGAQPGFNMLTSVLQQKQECKNGGDEIVPGGIKSLPNESVQPLRDYDYSDAGPSEDLPAYVHQSCQSRSSSFSTSTAISSDCTLAKYGLISKFSAKSTKTNSQDVTTTECSSPNSTSTDEPPHSIREQVEWNTTLRPVFPEIPPRRLSPIQPCYSPISEIDDEYHESVHQLHSRWMVPVTRQPNKHLISGSRFTPWREKQLAERDQIQQQTHCGSIEPEHSASSMSNGKSSAASSDSEHLQFSESPAVASDPRQTFLLGVQNAASQYECDQTRSEAREELDPLEVVQATQSMLQTIVFKTSVKRQRSPRKDKGQKRTKPYNTKKRRAEREATALVETGTGASI